MFRKVALILGLSVLTTVLSPHVSSAAPITPQTTLLATGDFGAAQKVQWDDWRYRRYEYGRYGGYYSQCQYWRRECARRWGWGGWEFQRCLWRHGCGRSYRY